MRKVYSVTAVFLALIAVSVFSYDIKYIRYQNVRFAFGVSYPEGLLIPQGESINGDGQKFISKDGTVIAYAYGFNNPDDYSLKHLFSEDSSSYSTEHPKRNITYKIIKSKWYVVSGVDGENVFYKKVYSRKNQYINFSMTYPVSKRKIFDPIVAVMSKSFVLIAANGK